MSDLVRSIDAKDLSNELKRCIKVVQTISEEIGTLVEAATQYLGEMEQHVYIKKSKIIRDSLNGELNSQLLLMNQKLLQASTKYVYASPEVWKIGDEQIESENSSKEYPNNHSIFR